MSDYGFATYDPQKKGGRLGVVNSKWPIFGPNYKDISTCYKTFHISDTTVNVAKNVDLGLSAPANLSRNYKYYTTYEPVFRTEHGFKKRPLGYVTFFGNVVKNTRCYIKQYHENGSAAFGGDFELNGVNTATIPVKSSMQGNLETAYASTSYNMYSNSLRETVFTIYDGSSSYPTGNIKVPTGVPSRVKDTYIIPWIDPDDPDFEPIPGGNASLPPYYAIIDDTYVTLYRRVYRADYLYRTDNVSTRVYDRVKAITDCAGTEIDMTIYLCPYSMEDLL